MSEQPVAKEFNIARYGMAQRIGLAGIIDRYAARIRSVLNCACEHIRLANEASDGWKSHINEHLPKSIVGFTPTSVVIDNKFHEQLAHHLLTPSPAILAQSLLTAGFSTFDAFLGTFLERL